MQEQKYYSHKHSRYLDLEGDGCPFDEWQRLVGERLFTRHPKGFLVFLPFDQLAASDEYVESDPYTVEKNIGSDFHKRRMSLTIGLLSEAVKDARSKPKILDLGCGQGHITNKMRLALPEAEISGLDYSVSAIEYAHDHFPGIDFAVGDAYDPPYMKGYFDVVVCNNLWEHVPDPLFLLSKIAEILTADSFLIISTPSRYQLYNLVRVLLGRPVSLISDHHVTEYTVGQVIEQLKYGGFEVVKISSKPINLHSLKAQIVRSLLSILISIVGSHHQLESTVFYLARKIKRPAGEKGNKTAE